MISPQHEPNFDMGGLSRSSLFDDSLRFSRSQRNRLDPSINELINMSRTIPILELFHAVHPRILLVKEWSVKLE